MTAGRGESTALQERAVCRESIVEVERAEAREITGNQERADVAESSIVNERAESHESAAIRERAVPSEGADHAERADSSESTDIRERAGSAKSAVEMERATFGECTDGAERVMGKWRTPLERGDGVTINKLGDERWVIRRGRQVVDECPCCDRPMLTPRDARQVADAVFPLVDAGGEVQPESSRVSARESEPRS